MKSVSFLTGTLLLLLIKVSAFAERHTTITLLHFSDYHSHAVPFYSEGQTNSAGIARAIAYLKPLASGFREPIPPGTIREEELRTALPYKNRILVYTLSGAQIQNLLNYSVSRSGSDFFSQVSGVRFRMVANQAIAIQVLKDPANAAAGYGPLDPVATYTVATTDFQGLVAGGYKEIFAPATYQDTGIDVRDRVRNFIQTHSPVATHLDGRITIDRSEEH